MDFINQPISELLSPTWNKLYQFLVWMFISDNVGNDWVYKTYWFAVIFTWIVSFIQHKYGLLCLVVLNIIIDISMFFFFEFIFMWLEVLLCLIKYKKFLVAQIEYRRFGTYWLCHHVMFYYFIQCSIHQRLLI